MSDAYQQAQALIDAAADMLTAARELLASLEAPPAPQPEPPRLYTEPEAMELLRVSRSTMKRLRRDGEIQFIRWGEQVRYTREQLWQFLATHTREGEEEEAA